jgi:hypothetical protein
MLSISTGATGKFAWKLLPDACDAVIDSINSEMVVRRDHLAAHRGRALVWLGAWWMQPVFRLRRG